MENEEKEQNNADLKQKLEECEKMRDEYLAGWQRQRADFLNYKKEELERLERMKELEKMEIILKILKIIDDFERAKKEIPLEMKDSGWINGIIQIEARLKKFLEIEGVKEIEMKDDEKFNPNFHEAIDEVEVEGKESGQIVEIAEKGYLINGQLLRPVRVRVSK